MTGTAPKFWRVHCHIGHHPGQWQYWFREQCCAVGWHPPSWNGVSAKGWEFDGHASDSQAWSAARNALRRAKPGDWIIATLPYNRVGRLGRIVELAVADDQWNPIVAPSRSRPFGENGRRILVRWDLTVGPDDPSKVVLLPPAVRFNSGEVQGTVRELPGAKLEPVRDAMRDDANWVSLAGSFKLETALSDYIAIHPQRLEAGMIAHPFIEVREFTFSDKRRSDVILQDRSGRVVIAECKQGAPTSAALVQLDHYRTKLVEQHPELGDPRAVLVHGGASRVLPEIAEEATLKAIELVYFELQVNFFGRRFG